MNLGHMQKEKRKDVLATIVAALLQRISAAHAAEAERTST